MTLHTYFLFILMFSSSLFAATAKTVTHDTKTDFARGTLKNVTVLFDGTLKTAPVKTRLLDTGEPFIWSMAEDSRGNLYIGTGNDGKVFKLTAAGDSSVVLDVDELFIFALLVDAADNLYAATSPNGKVYKVTPAGESTIFFDPEATYIWDLALAADGNILVATGEQAFIYSVSPRGESRILFDADENHVRSLLVDGQTVYAGTSGNGFVYRFTSDEKPFVLFDPQMEEVNQIVLGDDNFIYVSAFGEPLTLPTPRTAATQSQNNQSTNNGNDEDDENESAIDSQSINLESIVRSGGAPTSLFRISPDGYAKDLWLGSDEKIQSIFSHGDDILVGSGKSGTLLTVNADGDLSILLENGETHVTELAKNRQGKIIYTTSNLGRVYQIEETTADTASFISETIDAGLPAHWGTLVWEGNEAAKSTRFYTRSGNTEQPSQTWSDWTAVEKSGDVARIKSPGARFVQWKCELKNKEAAIDKVSLSYIQKNLQPTISSIFIHRPNDFYENKSNGGTERQGITFPAPLPNKQNKKGFRTVDWLFDDPNFDALYFDVFYRRVKSNLWRQMASNLDVNYHSWDSAQMADGDYEIKIVATDKLANPANLALTGEKISKPFTVDNTGPVIQPGNKKSTNVLTVRISDDLSRLDKVQYSIDAADWQDIFPTDGIMDSKTEIFDIPLPDGDVHDIAIKARDEIDNVSVVHTAPQ